MTAEADLVLVECLGGEEEAGEGQGNVDHVGRGKVWSPLTSLDLR